MKAAGNPTLLTQALKTTLVEHAAGNYRILRNLCDEMLSVACAQELAQLDEKLFMETVAPPQRPKAAAWRKR